MSEREGHIDWPDLERYSDTPMFNTKAVVQRTGVPAPTLRAWERRYTIIAPERAGNAYRLYTERHIVLIRWLKERVDAGMSISQAIALFRHLSEEHQRDALAPEAQTANETGPAHENIPMFQVAIDPSEHPAPPDDPLQPLQGWPILGDEPAHHSYPATHNMQTTRERLIEAFCNLDEPMAHMIMGTMLSVYPVEQVCSELITPTLIQVGQLWSNDHMTVPEEHFASNFFRGLLTNLFHVTPGPLSGPHALVCCAPGEPHEIGALMLALFLRRRGIRVAYMGQSIEAAGLIRTINKLMPVLVCLSLTMPGYLPALLSLARQISQLPPPRPIFAVGGQAITQSQYSDIIAQIPGLRLDGDLRNNADYLRALILERSENKN